MSADELAGFEGLPYWQDAVKLRRYDDLAKIKALATPDVTHFLPAVAACLRKAG